MLLGVVVNVPFFSFIFGFLIKLAFSNSAAYPLSWWFKSENFRLQLSPNIVKAENEWDFTTGALDSLQNSSHFTTLRPPPPFILSLSSLPVSDFYSAPLWLRHTSYSPFHTVIQSVWGLCFPPPPHSSLFLLQPLFLWVRLIPSPFLHQLLVWSQTAVGQSDSFLLLVQGQCQRWEVVHVFSVLPERVRGNRRELHRVTLYNRWYWLSIAALYNHYDSYIAMFRFMRPMRRALTGEGISSTAVWGTTSDRQSSACPLIHCRLGCSEWSWHSLFYHPTYQRGCSEPGPHCLPPHLSPGKSTNKSENRLIKQIPQGMKMLKQAIFLYMYHHVISS